MVESGIDDVVKALLTTRMNLMRPVIALDPRQFGRGRKFLLELVGRGGRSSATFDELKLFASTFCFGFLFVALYFA